MLKIPLNCGTLLGVILITTVLVTMVKRASLKGSSGPKISGFSYALSSTARSPLAGNPRAKVKLKASVKG